MVVAYRTCINISGYIAGNIVCNIASNIASNIADQQYWWISNIADNIANNTSGNIADSAILLTLLLIIHLDSQINEKNENFDKCHKM